MVNALKSNSTSTFGFAFNKELKHIKIPSLCVCLFVCMVMCAWMHGNMCMHACDGQNTVSLSIVSWVLTTSSAFTNSFFKTESVTHPEIAKHTRVAGQ